MPVRSDERQAFYDDVMVTFTEGGIQMVGQILNIENDTTRGFYSGLEGVHPYKAVTVRYYDDDVHHVVTVDTLSKAFTAMRNGEVQYLSESSRKRLNEAYREMDAGEIDAVDATNIVEIGLFGKVVYG